MLPGLRIMRHWLVPVVTDSVLPFQLSHKFLSRILYYSNWQSPEQSSQYHALYKREGLGLEIVIANAYVFGTVTKVQNRAVHLIFTVAKLGRFDLQITERLAPCPRSYIPLGKAGLSSNSNGLILKTALNCCDILLSPAHQA